RGIPGLAPYVAAKHGVVGLTRSAELEFADRDVRVSALVTGNVDRRSIGVCSVFRRTSRCRTRRTRPGGSQARTKSPPTSPTY
ncbi:MAG TPA: SDR family NAD(P)-dependent oxidoreductase, partial [Micromonosporaceae bacterium]|nr:SDR family NAD(P)-dependent oxidoreductase [Micromonosporaceae bacterium]